ncbi:hypothetical protein AVEN_167342-1 [Araneus ventricosus]|uniref:Uncharacterized protein n=1 Tax=Araneus ventricosus TaxID=182803 RepID=A0A4Y2DFD7_ARAVE|nr:hypothetical protein AVEN_167342-1 [Araneus ventricosus]
MCTPTSVVPAEDCEEIGATGVEASSSKEIGKNPDFSQYFEYPQVPQVDNLWPSLKASTSEPEGPRLETRFHRRYAVYVGLLPANLYVVTKRPLAGVVGKLGSLCSSMGREVPAQVQSSSSDRSSKFQG